MDDRETLTLPRPRVSLLTLFLITALVATSLSTALLWQEVGPLRRDLRRLREEIGAITIRDASRPHAIQVDTGNRHRWKWRVWVPEGRRYVVRYVHENVPAKGIPSGKRLGGTLDAGEHVIDHRLEPEEDRWLATIKTKRAVGVTRVGWGMPRWLDCHGVAEETRDFDADRPVVVWRQRVSDTANPKNTRGPTEGFMIWLEPVL